MDSLSPESIKMDHVLSSIPIPSMYGIFTYIYHKNQLNVGKYTMHGWYGIFYLNLKVLLGPCSTFFWGTSTMSPIYRIKYITPSNTPFLSKTKTNLNVKKWILF